MACVIVMLASFKVVLAMSMTRSIKLLFQLPVPNIYQLFEDVGNIAAAWAVDRELVYLTMEDESSSSSSSAAAAAAAAAASSWSPFFLYFSLLFFILVYFFLFVFIFSIFLFLYCFFILLHFLEFSLCFFAHSTPRTVANTFHATSLAAEEEGEGGSNMRRTNCRRIRSAVHGLLFWIASFSLDLPWLDLTSLFFFKNCSFLAVQSLDWNFGQRTGPILGCPCSRAEFQKFATTARTDSEPCWGRLKHRFAVYFPRDRHTAVSAAAAAERSHHPQDTQTTAHAFPITLVVQGNKLPQMSINVYASTSFSQSRHLLNCPQTRTKMAPSVPSDCFSIGSGAEEEGQSVDAESANKTDSREACLMSTKEATFNGKATCSAEKFLSNFTAKAKKACELSGKLDAQCWHFTLHPASWIRCMRSNDMCKDSGIPCFLDFIEKLCNIKTCYLTIYDPGHERPTITDRCGTNIYDIEAVGLKDAVPDGCCVKFDNWETAVSRKCVNELSSLTKISNQIGFAQSIVMMKPTESKFESSLRNYRKHRNVDVPSPGPSFDSQKVDVSNSSSDSQKLDVSNGKAPSPGPNSDSQKLDVSSSSSDSQNLDVSNSWSATSRLDLVSCFGVFIRLLHICTS